MEFLTALKAETNVAYTENRAKTNRSSLDPVLDFFALAGAMRKNQDEAITLFEAAYKKDPLLAVRTMFYLRDIRGGQGERALFRAFLLKLYELSPITAERILHFIPEYGRWDDMPLTETTVHLIAQQFEIDEAAMRENKGVSLMAKWLPSENTSSKGTTRTARTLANALNLSYAQYRRKVVALRKYIELLEQKMSRKEWDNLDYSKIPSQALRKYTKAFRRNDPQGYEQFLAAVESGEKKINTNTLFTYEVLGLLKKDEATANALWENLPDYTNGKHALVVADVSGSMGMWGFGDSPINVSVSLALYFAERNVGAFKDHFLTFSENSHLVKVEGRTLKEKVSNIANTGWGYNTNIQSAFNAILNAAKSGGVQAEDMPKILYIISDMQFDEATSGNNVTNFEQAKKMYESAGLSLPHVVFWNVSARRTETPALAADGNVTLISGLSQSTFRYAVEGKTPRQSMEDILNSERYSQIVI